MKIVIVEDEEVVAGRLMRLIRVILGDQIDSLIHLASVDEAVKHISSNPLDLLLLDLNLSGRDGFGLLRQSVAGAFQTIIVSAHHDQALRAFEHGVTDFVPKPYDEARLRTALSRVTQRDDSVHCHLRYLAVRHSGEIVLVPIEEVVFIKGAGDYSELHFRDETTLLHDKTLSTLERLLPERFTRVHRSYIVDTTSIESYRSEPGSRYSLRLISGVEIPIGRSRFKSLKQRLV